MSSTEDVSPRDVDTRFIASRIFQFLVRSRVAWQADLERYLIVLSFIAVGYIEADKHKTNIQEALRDHVRLSAQTISDMTSIPRETTRRKLDILSNMGVVSLDERSLYYMDQVPHGADIVAEIAGYIARADS